MVRFHGRNTAAWNVKSETASERFRYDYPEGELASGSQDRDARRAGARDARPHEQLLPRLRRAQRAGARGRCWRSRRSSGLGSGPTPRARPRGREGRPGRTLLPPETARRAPEYPFEGSSGSKFVLDRMLEPARWSDRPDLLLHDQDPVRRGMDVVLEVVLPRFEPAQFVHDLADTRA